MALKGFARMDRDKVREIAAKGGKAAHEQGKAHCWTSEEARIYGSKGGKASRAKSKIDPDSPVPFTITENSSER